MIYIFLLYTFFQLLNYIIVLCTEHRDFLYDSIIKQTPLITQQLLIFVAEGGLPEPKKLYRATEEYGLRDLSPPSFLALHDRCGKQSKQKPMNSIGIESTPSTYYR